MQLAININKTSQLQHNAVEDDHISHCFDYLRQAIMCAGDSTLEWPRIESDGRRFAVDGWGVQHQCRDWVSDDNHLKCTNV